VRGRRDDGMRGRWDEEVRSKELMGSEFNEIR